MSLDATAQTLLKVGTDAIPPIFRDDARVLDDLHAMAAMMGKVEEVGRDMLARAMVGTASQDAGGADWLSFLAGDYGTSRQDGETDTVMRERMRTTPAGVIRRELLALAQSIVEASGITEAVAMVEMPRDQAHVGAWVQNTGTGGAFAAVGTQMKFTPTVPFAFAPCAASLSGPIESVTITFSGSSSAGNDGTFTVDSIDGNGAAYTNASGVAGTDGGATWATARIERASDSVEGFAMAYCDRGYRAWFAPGDVSKQSLSGIIMILPYGCTDSARRSVQEMLRQRGAAGVVKRVEVRITP